MTISPIADSSLALAAVRAAGRNGVWRRRDLASSGSDSRIRAQLRGGRWQAPFPQVIVLHNGPLTPAQKMWSAFMAAPPGAMLHGLSALEHDGFRAFAPDSLAIVIPGSSADPRPRQLSAAADWRLQVRWSRELSGADVNDVAVPPRTRPARSVLDAASERIAPWRARAIVLASVQERLVRPAALWDALSRRGRCRNRAVIAESIDDAAGGIHSVPEREFDRIRSRLGIPEPTRQLTLRHEDGRHYLDNAWDEFGIRVEIHGVPHLEIAQWDEDLLRQNDISVTGALLVFSSYAVRHRQERVAEQLVRMFRSRGWSG
jgi:hypothetical protein